MKYDRIVIQVPEDMRDIPRYWDPRLPWHFAELRDLNVFPVDWALTREPVDALTKVLITTHEVPEEVHLWCMGWKSLHRALTLHNRLLKAWKCSVEVYGLPKIKIDPNEPCGLNLAKWIGERSLQQIEELEPAHWPWFPDIMKNYTERSLPFITTLGWRQRLPITFRFPCGAMKPKKVARKLLKLKHTVFFDSVDWVDDLTTDYKWFKNVIEEVEDYDMSFEFTCRGVKERVNIPLLQFMRERGMRVIDFGKVPISWWNSVDSPDVGRLEAAIVACRQVGVFSTLTFMLDKGTTLESARKACEFSVSADLSSRPEVDVVPEELALQELDDISAGKWYNPTELADLQLLGVTEAFEWARPERIR